jgi:hypothetical protein
MDPRKEEREVVVSSSGPEGSVMVEQSSSGDMKLNGRGGVDVVISQIGVI